MKKIISAVLFTLLVGCSSEPVRPDQAKDISPATDFVAKPGTVPLTIIRDKSYVAGGCAITAFVNGHPVAKLETSEKVTAFVKPGNIIVGAAFKGKGLCSGAAIKEREFNVTDGQPRNLRIFIDQSGNVDVLPMT
ncbi:hypothetical protein [Siccibacter turicensis]